MTMKYHKDDASREKHSGSSDVPEFEWHRSEWVGKCPRGKSEADAQRLLDGALHEATSAAFPHKAWNIDELGHVYRATVTGTEDGVYHGFPERVERWQNGASTPAWIRRNLEERARVAGVYEEMQRWLKKQPEPPRS